MNRWLAQNGVARALRVMLFVVVGLIAAAFIDRAYAQEPAGRRVALVVGNGAYRSAPALANPPRDAGAIADSLRRVGFQVELLLDADRAVLMTAVHRLSGAATGAEVALFFYAGHAMEVGGQNLLVSVSAPVNNSAELRRSSVSFEEISSALQGRARTTLIFLDACRDNPIVAESAQARPGRGRTSGNEGSSRSVGGGLASVASASGTLIAFATAPGQVALDGTGQNSPFTKALLEHITTPGLEVRQLLGRVRRTVREMTGGSQVPWDNSSLEGEFYFVAVGTAVIAPPARPSSAIAPPLRQPSGPSPVGSAPLCPPRNTVVGLSTGQVVRYLGTVESQPDICLLANGERRIANLIPFDDQSTANELTAARQAISTLYPLAVGREGKVQIYAANYLYPNLRTPIEIEMRVIRQDDIVVGGQVRSVFIIGLERRDRRSNTSYSAEIAIDRMTNALVSQRTVSLRGGFEPLVPFHAVQISVPTQ